MRVASLQKMRKMYRRNNSLCLFLLVVSLLLLGCSSVDVDVGVILDTNSSDSPVGRTGLCWLNMAHNDFYATHPNYTTRLALQVFDSNGTVVGAGATAIDLLQAGNVVAIIGPQKSIQVNFVIDLGEMANVPILLFSATSPSLVHSTSYFLQTAQSDDKQVNAIASIVNTNRWGQVVIIYEDSEFGNGILPYLSNALQDVNARVSYRGVLHKLASDEAIKAELYKMITMQTRVFVVHMTQYLAARLFMLAKELQMMTQGYAWIVTSGLTDLFKVVDDMNVVDAMQGVIGVRPVVPSSTISIQTKPLFGECSGPFINWMKPSNAVSIFGLWAYDTFSALAMAIERIWKNEFDAATHATKMQSVGKFDIKVSKMGPKLLKAIQETRFTGLAGEFHLVDGQQTQTPYEIVNVVGRDLTQVGMWRPDDDAPRATNSTSKETFKNIIWPGYTMSAPRGWEIPVSETKLRIGVPQKHGFNDFLKVDIDPQTNATKVSGYFKEIFDEVIASLPYALPYKYSAYPFFQNDRSIGTYDSLVHEVFLQERYDAALGDITITANRSAWVDFSLPYAEGGVTGMIPVKYADEDDLFTFLKPLTIELWIAIVVFYLITAWAIWFVACRNISECKDPHAGMICYFPIFPGQDIQALLMSLILVSWAFVASLISSTYTASLSSRLTASRLLSEVTDVSQLINEGHSVGCQDGSFLIDFLLNLGFHSSKIIAFKSSEDCIESLCLGREKGGVSAYFDVMPHIRLLVSRNCSKYRMFGPVYRTDGFGFAFPKGSPVVADISRAVVQLTEKGIIKEINQQITTDPVCLDSNGSTVPSRVTLRSFAILFGITGFTTVACIVATFFIYPHQRRSLRERMFNFKTNISSKVQTLHKYLKHINPMSQAKVAAKVGQNEIAGRDIEIISIDISSQAPSFQ